MIRLIFWSSFIGLRCSTSGGSGEMCVFCNRDPCGRGLSVQDAPSLAVLVQPLHEAALRDHYGPRSAGWTMTGTHCLVGMLGYWRPRCTGRCGFCT
jgi:hypothetical protein